MTQDSSEGPEGRRRLCGYGRLDVGGRSKQAAAINQVVVVERGGATGGMAE